MDLSAAVGLAISFTFMFVTVPLWGVVSALKALNKSYREVHNLPTE